MALIKSSQAVILCFWGCTLSLTVWRYLSTEEIINQIKRKMNEKEIVKICFFTTVDVIRVTVFKPFFPLISNCSCYALMSHESSCLTPVAFI